MTFTRTTRTLAVLAAMMSIGCATAEERAAIEREEAHEARIELNRKKETSKKFYQPVETARDHRAEQESSEAGIAIAVKDFDGDGMPDLVMAGPANGLRYFKGTQRGFLLSPYAIQEASGEDYEAGVAIAAGDMNGDRLEDLVIAGPAKGIRYYEGNGKGQFTYRGTVGKFEKGPEEREHYKAGVSVALADINHDGKLDIIAAGPSFGVRYIISNIRQEDPLKDIKKKP